MPILPKLITGPAIITFNGKSYYSQAGFKAEFIRDTFKIATDFDGTIDERAKTQRTEITFQPDGQISTLNKYFPYSVAQIGSSIFGTTNLPLVIQTKFGGASNTGQTITYPRAALSKLPQLRLKPTDTLFGEMTFTCLGDPTVQPTGASAWQAIADTAFFVPYGPWVTLWRDRAQNSDGTFTGGTSWFQGVVTQVPRAGAPNAESLLYKICGPWWFLDHMVFQQPYQNIFLGYATAGDPTTAPIYGQAHSSHLFLNQGAGSSGTALLKITTGQQIIEALNWALKPFTDVGASLPFQIGTITPAVDVPIDEVRDITCAEVIHKMLRWSPDAVAWFDYATSPPTFHCKRRAELTTLNLDISQT